MTEITPILNFYIEKQKELESRYTNVVVMIEVGKFYEVYGCETLDGTVGKAKEVSQVCNIILTKKNKNVENSPYMCGFPTHSVSRFVQHLVNNKFTVAIYDQRQINSNKIVRELRSIYSPAVCIEEEFEILEGDGERGLLAVYYNTFQDLKNTDCKVVVLVYVNTSNGNVVCEEECFSDTAEVATFLVKIRDVLRPQEVLWKGCNDNIKRIFENSLLHEIPEWKGNYRKFTEIEFQQTFLSKVYKDDKEKHVSVIENIGLERHPDIVPIFVYTLYFLGEHHPLTIYRLSKPSFECRSGHVFYSSNSLYDLNMIHCNGANVDKSSLFSLVNHTTTPMGYRLLRKKLLTPEIDMDKLNHCYEEIAAFINKDLDLKKRIQYSHIDVEHVLRRIQLGNISVQCIYRFIKFLLDMASIYNDMPVHLSITQKWKENNEGIENWISFIRNTWDLQLMQAWRTWETDHIWLQLPDELLEKESILLTKEKEIKDWLDKEWTPEAKSRMVLTEDDIYIQATKKMYNSLKNKPNIRVKSMTSNYRLYHPILDRFFIERREIMSFLIRTKRNVFHQQVQKMMLLYEKYIEFLVHTSARLDVILSNAYNVVKYRLSKPIPTTDKVLSLKGLRHLIVETNTEFVPNDVVLDNKQGILLFGQNSAGKCFKKGTLMLLFDGSLKTVENLTLNDVLIGDDGKPRRILSMTRGYGALYDVIRTDTMEILMTVNGEHIMCLTDPDGSRIQEERVATILEGNVVEKYLMHQTTALNNNNMYWWKNNYPSILHTNDKNIIQRSSETDIVWKQVYRELILQGRRVHYSHDNIIVESLNRNIVPICIVPSKCVKDVFYGFGINGNQRFIMPDGTLAHNSTLMKSVGVSVMMAQAGMYVPCASMIWKPIHSLFTKIGSRDNIWAGKSTFVTEMSELKHILERSTEDSLVLCDELTSGTESYSATGIVAGTLEQLLHKHAWFIMTTHLHTLKQFTNIMEHPQLRIMHFDMEYKNNTLHFDRILRDGVGKSIYGLEIAEYLGFSKEFLSSAYKYRTLIDNSSPHVYAPSKRSRYNHKKWVDHCENCGKSDDLHVHHIKPQSNSESDGYIGAKHKNTLYNLKVLCKTCHELQHHHT